MRTSFNLELPTHQFSLTQENRSSHIQLCRCVQTENESGMQLLVIR